MSKFLRRILTGTSRIAVVPGSLDTYPLEEGEAKLSGDRCRAKIADDSASTDVKPWLSTVSREQNKSAAIKYWPICFGNSTSQGYSHDVKNVTEVSVRDKHRTTDTSSEDMLKLLLERAKPVLPDGVEEHLKLLERYHQKEAKDKPSESEYINAYEQALKKWCPDVWREYTENHVECVVHDEWDYAKLKREHGKWNFILPLKTAYPIDTLLRSINEFYTLKKEYLLNNKHDYDADFEMRISITARILEMNMELGSKGWEVTQKYPLAYQHKQDYEEGIYQALKDGSITIDTPAHDIRQKGYAYARKNLIDLNKPESDIPAIFLNTSPGSYLEEWNRFTKMKRQIHLKKPINLDKYIAINESIEINQENTILLIKEPVKIGTHEWTILMKFLEARKREEGKESTLKVVVLPNKEIWALPYRFSEKEKAKHSIVAMGRACVWAGEVDILGEEVIQLKGDSGHYETYNSDPAKQEAIFQFAVSAFRDQNYVTSGLKDVSVMGLRHANRDNNGIEHKPLSQ